MAHAKHAREKKRQLGQFLTPPEVAARLVADLDLAPGIRVLEPGFGAGAFLVPLVERFLALRGGDLERVLRENVAGIELDPDLHAQALDTLRERFGPLPRRHALARGDFLLEAYEPASFDLVVGNPPFGGTVSIPDQDRLDRLYGFRGGHKIKKETYSFFIVKALDLLRERGRLSLICSDTFLTIPTMKGLRSLLLDQGACRVDRLAAFSRETDWRMVVLGFEKTGRTSGVRVLGRRVPRSEIERTENFSWRAGGELARYFAAPASATRLLGEKVVATSGMTTGKNELFVREIVDGSLEEPYELVFFEEPITVEGERARARLNRLEGAKLARVREQEARGETRRHVRAVPRPRPLRVALPHPDYRPYNKATGELVWAPFRRAIFWRDDGDAVKTWKRAGRWYLHGVGGAPFFGREGITWPLVSARLNARYLPPGAILDSGAPCAFLRDGVPREELWFILGWALTAAATRILKEVLNHTRNIQSKDFERLPYPWWVSRGRKRKAQQFVRSLVERAQAGEEFERGHEELARLERLYELRATQRPSERPGS